MPKKMITKSCPKCVQQLPVACKACPCGHNFFSARRAVITAQAAEVRDEGIMKRRRTERVKRGKPNYYDALEYEKQTKKKRNRNTSDVHADQHRKGDCVEGQHRLKKKRKKKTPVEKEHEEKDISLPSISLENSLKCLVILAEINRKIGSTSWRE